MSVVLALLVGVPILGFFVWRAWAFFAGSRLLPAPPPGALPATLTITGVAPEYRLADEHRQAEAADAFCTVSGFLTGSDLPPTAVYRRVVIPVGAPWPQMGEELAAHHLPGRSATHWWLDPAVGWNGY